MLTHHQSSNISLEWTVVGVFRNIIRAPLCWLHLTSSLCIQSSCPVLAANSAPSLPSQHSTKAPVASFLCNVLLVCLTLNPPPPWQLYMWEGALKKSFGCQGHLASAPVTHWPPGDLSSLDNGAHPLFSSVHVVQLLSRVRLFATPWTAALQASPSFIISQDLLKLMSTELATPSNHLILCCPLLLLPSVFLSIRVLSNQLALWPKFRASVSASVLPMNIHCWFPLGWTGWISLLSKGISRVLSSTTVQKHQFFGAQPSLPSNSHICTWLLGKP